MTDTEAMQLAGLGLTVDDRIPGLAKEMVA